MKTNANTIDTETIKRNTNLIDLASRYAEMRKESSNEYSGACPKCGGDDRFHVTNEMFFCRQCYTLGNGKSHDTIAFVQWIDGCDFVTACSILDGTVAAPQRAMVQPVRKVATDKPWNEERERIKADDMHRSLMRGLSAQAKASMEYLVSRCINQETIEAYKIGWRIVTLPGTWDEAKKQLSYPRQIAISLPWFNHDGALVAVKYRFIESHTYTDIDGKERTENKTSRGNMAGQMFGWQALKGSRTCHTLVICEGELNALSIALAGDGKIDVLSAGNESQLSHLPQLAIEKAREYRNVIVWADREEIADSAALSIPLSKRYHSPVIAGYPKGLDANDILKAGKLSALLSAMTESVDDSLSDESTVNEMDVLAQVNLLLDDASRTSLDRIIDELEEQIYKNRDAKNVWRWLTGRDSSPAALPAVKESAKRLGVQL